ncbi:MAG: helix-turn-helix domain-containing protein [Planctomycetes bacterium]|nr:helix-turn-helix domain-containing protein [Planctomycetota bacterium]
MEGRRRRDRTTQAGAGRHRSRRAVAELSPSRDRRVVNLGAGGADLGRHWEAGGGGCGWLDSYGFGVDGSRRRGIPGLEKDAPGRGRQATVSPELVAEIIRITTQEDPPNATHWSTRDMAKIAGVSAATVGRIWKAHGLKPHLFRTFKVSRDPNFAEKLADRPCPREQQCR